MTAFFRIFFKYGFILLIIHTKWWVIKVKHPLSDVYQKYLAHEEQQNNTHDNIVSFI